jgi:hypothetical protein
MLDTEDDLIFLGNGRHLKLMKMENKLNLFGNGRQPKYFWKLKTISIFLGMEDDINLLFLEMENDLNPFGNRRRHQFTVNGRILFSVYLVQKTN